MADTNTRLTFEVVGNTAAAQSAVSGLASSVSSQFGSMQSVVNSAISSMTTNLTNFAGKTPAVSQAVSGVTSELSKMEGASVAAGGELAALAGPIGIAVAAALALAGVAVSLGTELFHLTQQAAEFQGKMLDLSQQTGISVETLSTLEVVAKTTGSSIEAITASLGIFQKNLEAAEDPTTKQSALIKRLGIDTTDTETAFRSALASLAKMPEGYHQTAAALELFGRGGKALLAILKETHGDLDGTTERLRSLGILITTDVAKSADNFNDTLEVLKFQVRAVSAIVGNEAMPIILKAIEELSRLLKENQGVIANWVHDIEDMARGAFSVAEALKAISEWTGALGVLEVPAVLTVLKELSGGALGGLADVLRLIGRNPDIGPVTSPDLNLATPITPERPGTVVVKKAGSKKTPQDAAYKADLEASAEAAKKEAETQRHLTEQLKLAHEESLLDLEDYYKKKQALIEKHFNDEINAINREQSAVDAARARGVAKKVDLDKRDADLTQRTNEAKNKLSEESRRLSFEREQARDKQALALEDQLLAIRDAQREGELQRIEAALDAQQITEEEAIVRRLALETQAYNDRKAIIDLELGLETTSAEKKTQLDNEKIASEQRYTNAVEKATAQRIAAHKKELQRQELGIGATGLGGLGQGVSGGVDISKGPFAAFSKELSDIGALSKNTSAIIGETLAGAFGSLAQGVGQAVQAFVLFGTVEGGFRKFAAEMIASIAATAAVQAVYELAQGLAWLALNFFFPNPEYAKAASTAFVSAAVFGSIAGVATIAGRGIAGNSFNQQSAAGGGAGGFGGGNGGTNSSTTRNSPTVINAERSRAPIYEIHLHGDAKALDVRVVKIVEKNVRGNGSIRRLIKNEN